MRFRRYGIILSLAILEVFVLYWPGDPRAVRPISGDKHSVYEGFIEKRHNLNKELRPEVARYRALEKSDWLAACEVARSVAASQSHLWEKCSQGVLAADIYDRMALAHFASAYFQRGSQQKDELVSLLHSQDVRQVAEVLYLLARCGPLSRNGDLIAIGGLGGAEIAQHIAQVYNTHPRLGFMVASNLRLYKAKDEIPTLLRISLSHDPGDVLEAVTALYAVDRDGVYTRFGLDAIQPMTGEQRAAIEKYLASLHR